VKTAYSYACKDYPGMESCPGRFTAETETEVMKHVELHASVAHGENPAQWSEDDRTYLTTLVKSK
jgi:predicted small metal-binding protein